MIMRKNCETCKHDDAEYPSYPHKTPCNECLHGKGYNDAPTKWEAADHYKPDTNADRIRSMSDEELARFFADKIENEYILSQKRLGYSEHTLTATQIEAIRHNCYCIWTRWLKQPAE
jgi:hypothetical protein